MQQGLRFQTVDFLNVKKKYYYSLSTYLVGILKSKTYFFQVKLFVRGQSQPKVISLHDIQDDLQTLYARTAASTFEFRAIVDGSSAVEGLLRYHPFLYDRETYPSDAYDLRSKSFHFSPF